MKYFTEEIKHEHIDIKKKKTIKNKIDTQASLNRAIF